MKPTTRRRTQAFKKQGVATAPPNDSLPFIVARDTDMVNWVKDDGSKMTLCLADLMCKLASGQGLMQVTLADHDLEQKVKDTSAGVSSSVHVCVFKHKCNTVSIALSSSLQALEVLVLACNTASIALMSSSLQAFGVFVLVRVL